MNEQANYYTLQQAVDEADAARGHSQVAYEKALAALIAAEWGTEVARS